LPVAAFARPGFSPENAMSEQDKKHEPTAEEQAEMEQVAKEVTEEALDQDKRDPDAETEVSAEEVQTLRSKLEQVEKKLSEADVRAQAEIQNVRKRAERDVEHAHKYALEKFSADILSVADSLERALATLDENDEALKPAREGTELTLKVLLDVFAKYGIEQVNPKEEAFNPELHEAMTMVPNPDLKPNTVVDVLEKGYTLHGRLLRPARVVVSKAE
jgi:molecular chaperone GrpE